MFKARSLIKDEEEIILKTIEEEQIPFEGNIDDESLLKEILEFLEIESESEIFTFNPQTIEDEDYREVGYAAIDLVEAVAKSSTKLGYDMSYKSLKLETEYGKFISINDDSGCFLMFK